jgi:hypothetical protein
MTFQQKRHYDPPPNPGGEGTICPVVDTGVRASEPSKPFRDDYEFGEVFKIYIKETEHVNIFTIVPHYCLQFGTD